jgi:3-oxoacyl-[acyl-carrier protein] reductase
LDAARGIGPRLRHIEADLADPKQPHRVIDYAVSEFGAVDALIANHARSAPGALASVTAEDLGAAWAVNARAVVLLIQAYAAQHDDARKHGRVVLFTSGQHIAPMRDELAYAISKGAVHQMTGSLADALADRGITVNTINAGPVDTGWPSDELRERLRGRSRPDAGAGRRTSPRSFAGFLTPTRVAHRAGDRRRGRLSTLGG